MNCTSCVNRPLGMKNCFSLFTVHYFFSYIDGSRLFLYNIILQTIFTEDAI